MCGSLFHPLVESRGEANMTSQKITGSSGASDFDGLNICHDGHLQESVIVFLCNPLRKNFVECSL